MEGGMGRYFSPPPSRSPSSLDLPFTTHSNLFARFLSYRYVASLEDLRILKPNEKIMKACLIRAMTNKNVF